MILLGFLLGFPANEIVLPIILMGYTAGTTLTETSDLSRIHEILTANGWTPVTALCMLLFLLFHFPCSTTCLTIRKETGSWKWTLAAWCIGAYLWDSSRFEGLFPQIISQLSLFARFYTIVNGVFDVTAIVYYLSVTGFFLFLSVQSLEKRRWSE